ncbi:MULTISPECIES: M15 family metallopeptidase [Idiomarina]|jgi:peptidoglycan L-alanyl-D-glutamate endopeptidase CwlK|uniref:M15 family metallopeptidase n=1 Tax=Idiomarina TaxID=135575 RepID=UPI00129B560C|nr:MULTISPECIES: M15 family metallopeptidase [Idiomarina]MRJ41176.1 M15 family peptidase [Idiomarina sp. FeN1]NCU56341.1 M15 family peptidase [Idiomarina sp. FenA--70]NCU59360.1 M15 family peptidase [Idiomarina sp. FenBw--71]UUN12535.1 M15 family metallopeptidase [Idiomarina loihiensis]
MSNFRLSKTSLLRLKQCHPQLCIVVTRAIQICGIDFMVGCGIRTIEEQRANVEKGVSKTLASKHLPQADGMSHAVDLWPWVNGRIPWEDWPAFEEIAKAMLTAADELGVNLRWGGDWNRNGRSDDERFLDGPHFELVGAL